MCLQLFQLNSATACDTCDLLQSTASSAVWQVANHISRALTAP
jgi:hypothetical protein